MKRLSYNDDLEKLLSAVFGIVGILAIFVNVGIKGFTAENILDAVKDVAGLVVTIAVFLIASKIFRSMSFEDFVGKFEEYLREWAEQNAYLIDTTSIEEERGQEGKRCYKMLTDHSNFVIAEAPAHELNKLKGAFLYLPPKNAIGDARQVIEFRVNVSTFKRQKHYKDVKDIAKQFATRINDEFAELLNIQAEISQQDSNKIIVSLENVERTEESAKRLIDLVEFVKTMALALA